jgi:hypothetical protein
MSVQALVFLSTVSLDSLIEAHRVACAEPAEVSRDALDKLLNR